MSDFFFPAFFYFSILPQHSVMRRHRPYDKEKEKGNDFSANGEGGGARPSARRPLTCLGRRVLLAPLEGVPEQQLIAPAPRAHQNHADGAGVVPHPAGGLGRGRAGAKAGTGPGGGGAVGTPRWTGRGRGTERSEDWLGAGAEGSQADVSRATVTQTRLPPNAAGNARETRATARGKRA